MIDSGRPAWTPSSWRAFPARQLPAYPDEAILAGAEARLASAPAVVDPSEAERFRQVVAKALAGDGFLLQGGDCAERLCDDPSASAEHLASLFDRLVAAFGPASDTVVPIARAAGQFAKPRSQPTERRGDIELPAYRGDLVNEPAFDEKARRPDPSRLIAAHRHARTTATALARRASPIFTSHEALHLPYEEALLRRDPSGRWWAGSGHMLWIGERTRQVDGAHATFLSGIGNVVGVKCGPTLEPGEMVALARLLEPQNRRGKLLLIGRFGAERIGNTLPRLLRVCRSEGLAALWMIDPMHGNTRVEDGRKIRPLDAIRSETRQFVEICSAEGVRPAGLHLEMTPQPVAECEPGQGVEAPFLSPCDPRLNAGEALEIVSLMARLLAGLQESAA